MAKVSGYGAVAAALLAFPALAEESALTRFCALTEGGDEAREAVCLERQLRGALSVARYLDWAAANPGPDADHVRASVALCEDRWAPDQHLIDACLRARAGIAPP